MFISPGVDPNKYTNPGVAMFEVSDAGVPFNLKMEFIDLLPQLGKKSIAYSDLQFNSLAMTEYGVNNLTANDLNDFRRRLEADNKMALEYMNRKLGYNESSAEKNMGIDVYKTKMKLVSSNGQIGSYIC